MDSDGLPSDSVPYDPAESFISLENLPIYCKLCKQHSIGEPCWTHARTISDRVVTPLAIASLPEVLYFEPTDELSGKAVHTSVFIPLHTVFGPLMAPLYNRPPVSSDPGKSSSQQLEEFQLENDHFCNWFKYVRAAADSSEQNLAVCINGIAVMFVATRPIQPHEELKVYHPLSAKKTKSSFLHRNLRIESDIVGNHIPDFTTVNNDELLPDNPELDEIDPVIDSLHSNAPDVTPYAVSPEYAENVTSDFSPNDEAEPEVSTLPANGFLDVVLPPVLPLEHPSDLDFCEEHMPIGRRAKRNTVAERSVLRRGKAGLRRSDVSFADRLDDELTSLVFANEPRSALSQTRSVTLKWAPVASSAIQQTGRNTRLSSLSRKRKLKEMIPNLPTSDVPSEPEDEQGTSVPVADSVMVKKKRGKRTQDTCMNKKRGSGTQDTIVNSKRITRLSATTARPKVSATMPALLAALHSTPDDSAQSEMDIVTCNAIEEEDDEDYAPSDASDSEPLLAKKLRPYRQYTPANESSLTEKLVKVERVVKPVKSCKPQKPITPPRPREPPSVISHNKRIFRRDYDAYVYRYPCPHCPLKYYSTRLLNLHKYQHEADSTGAEFPSDLTCIDCGYTGKDGMDLSKHTDSHGKNVGEMTELASVEPEHHSHPHCYAYSCENQDCLLWFCTEILWRQHRLLHYPLLPVEIESLQCTACDYLAADAQDLAQHTTHHGRKCYARVKCPVCFHTVTTINKHVLYKHPEYLKMVSLDYPLVCPTCPMRFVTQFTLSKHRRFCKRKLNQCYMCVQQFETKHLLQQHFKSHMVDNKYPCPNCDFVTHGLQYIRKHMEHRHELSRIRVCEICQMVVNSSKRLQIHMKTHDQTMNFLCDICGNRYNTSFSLNQHKHYVHKGRLKVKLQRKAQEKREKGETTKTPGKVGLTLEDYPFRCEECQTGFLKPGLLARHMQDKHGG